MMKRLNQLPVILAALFLFYLSPSALEAQPVTTSVQVPLAGTVFVPLTDGSLDQVNLLGAAHVVTHFNPATPTDPMRISFNLDGVTGVGDLTGLKYIATGANRINFPTFPADRISLSFDLIAPLLFLPDSPKPTGIPVDISFALTFNQDTAELLNVDIELMSVPRP
jgi:hypothetical protein